MIESQLSEAFAFIVMAKPAVQNISLNGFISEVSSDIR